MGKRGPAGKEPKLRALEALAHRPIPAELPMPEGVPDEPVWESWFPLPAVDDASPAGRELHERAVLSREMAHDFWSTMVPMLDEGFRLRLTDGPVLIALTVTWVKYHNAVYLEGRLPGTQKYFMQQKGHLRSLRELLKSLAMTPADRLRLASEMMPEQTDADREAALMRAIR